MMVSFIVLLGNLAVKKHIIKNNMYNNLSCRHRFLQQHLDLHDSLLLLRDLLVDHLDLHNHLLLLLGLRVDHLLALMLSCRWTTLTNSRRLGA